MEVVGSRILFKNFKNIRRKGLLRPALVLALLIGIFALITLSIGGVAKTNRCVFSYTIKVHDTVEELDRVFERSELNVNVMVDSISNSYNAGKQQDKAYNLNFIEGIDGLVKSVLVNSPGINGSWFQINADLPFSGSAYNWYSYNDNKFVDVKDQFSELPSLDRKITPEDDPYYFNAVTKQKPVWSDVYVDADTKNEMITISAPIYKDGLLVGVTGIDIAMVDLGQILKDMQLVLGDSELYLLDKQNKVILSQLAYNSASPKDKYPFLGSFRGNSEGPVEYTDSSEKKTAIRLMLSNGYKIVIAIDNKSLFAGTNQIITIVYGMFVLLVIAVLIALWSQSKTNKSTQSADKEIDVIPENED